MAATNDDGQTGGKLPWNEKNAVAAFTAVLTKSATDDCFRKRLTDSAESAKKMVSEVGNIEVPASEFILFFEPEAEKAGGGMEEFQPQMVPSSRDNHRYHIFWLPPFNPGSKTQHHFKDHLRCCYPVWLTEGSSEGSAADPAS